jgi:hypothetical protein
MLKPDVTGDDVQRICAAAACLKNDQTLPHQRHAVKDFFPIQYRRPTRPSPVRETVTGLRPVSGARGALLKSEDDHVPL